MRCIISRQDHHQHRRAERARRLSADSGALRAIPSGDGTRFHIRHANDISRRARNAGNREHLAGAIATGRMENPLVAHGRSVLVRHASANTMPTGSMPVSWTLMRRRESLLRHPCLVDFVVQCASVSTLL